jgi:hypothetical protein
MNGQYKRAFGLLVIVLERLDETEKIKLINYYNNILFK